TNPINTLIVSPNNASREAINHAVRFELKEKGTIAKDDHIFRVLTPRSEMTSACRVWAQKYRPDIHVLTCHLMTKLSELWQTGRRCSARIGATRSAPPLRP